LSENAPSCPDLLFAPGSTRTVEGAASCANEWRQLDCGASSPACATPGTRLAGEDCVSGFQCAAQVCTREEDACGECAMLVGAGEACDYRLGLICEPGLYCDTTSGGVCAEPDRDPTQALELGEECNPGSGTCYPNDCRADAQGVHRCQPYPTLGQDCSVRLTCAFGDSYCDLSHVCLEFPDVGEACGVDGFTGAAQWCAEGATCDRTQEPPTCVDRPGANEACVGTCQAGLACYCDNDACQTKSCKRLRFPGEACAAPEDVCVVSTCTAGTCIESSGAGLLAELCLAS
jgi:hypothetical protein